MQTMHSWEGTKLLSLAHGWLKMWWSLEAKEPLAIIYVVLLTNIIYMGIHDYKLFATMANNLAPSPSWDLQNLYEAYFSYFTQTVIRRRVSTQNCTPKTSHCELATTMSKVAIFCGLATHSSIPTSVWRLIPYHFFIFCVLRQNID